MFVVFAADSLDSASAGAHKYIVLPSLLSSSDNASESLRKALASVCRSGDTTADGVDVTASFKRIGNDLLWK